MSARRNGGGGSGGGLLLVVLAAAVCWLLVKEPALLHAPGLTAAATPSAVAVGDIPAGYLAQYRRAGSTCPGLDWALLAGIGKVETDHGRSTAPGVTSGTNYAGAGGPMQFLAGTWDAVRARHADIGPNLYNPGNAIPGAAHYLCDSGMGPGAAATRQALWSYNHSTPYADQVLALAARYRAAGSTR